ncbi:N-acetyl-1-D-myo-inositol-2-amino-2-deoxy-alpha-D-glucopyranoside deacetylase [uncultured Jatrophihabitans sp.]|uniref:N-acetyl-1-D-myo-inositol-2-amino-2-deoxy-alpha- D-glucopyranoside deacetylase n=1 Tax=uncultured Jatrophihabitans sp. TaxID=1610747 RepID=UPI0035CBA32B
MSGRRLLLVHAHPDDESITTGAVMAHYAQRGVRVVLLTCTLGEEGEVLVPALQGLAADRADQLGGYRIAELGAAMGALGVTDHRFLGGAGHFRDSGMAGSSANAHPRAFCRADGDATVFTEAVEAAADVVREVRPDAVVTYDPDGGYGHPDHVMAHRVTMAAVVAAAEGGADAWSVPRVFWTADPDSVLDRDVAALADRPDAPFSADRAALSFGVPDRLVTTVVDAADGRDAKRSALLAHATQVSVWSDFYALSNGLGRLVSGTEYFRAAPGYPAPPSDLFGDVA